MWLSPFIYGLNDIYIYIWYIYIYDRYYIDITIQPYIVLRESICLSIPIGSMYGIFTNIYPKNHPNVGKHSIHGASGIWLVYVSKKIRWSPASDSMKEIFYIDRMDNHEKRIGSCNIYISQSVWTERWSWRHHLPQWLSRWCCKQALETTLSEWNQKKIYPRWIIGDIPYPWRIHGAGIFTYIYPKNHPNVGKYTIHGASGLGICHIELGGSSHLVRGMHPQVGSCLKNFEDYFSSGCEKNHCSWSFCGPYYPTNQWLQKLDGRWTQVTEIFYRFIHGSMVYGLCLSIVLIWRFPKMEPAPKLSISIGCSKRKTSS